MRSADWSSREGYRAFLQIQHAARLPIEQWIEENGLRDMAVTPQSYLIERDLEALGSRPIEAGLNFDLPAGADAIGLAWAIAGSSLGNKAILREISAASAGQWPTAFLSDDGMTEFWKRIRPILDSPCEPARLAAAETAAMSVFDHFIAVAETFVCEQV